MSNAIFAQRLQAGGPPLSVRFGTLYAAAHQRPLGLRVSQKQQIQTLPQRGTAVLLPTPSEAFLITPLPYSLLFPRRSLVVITVLSFSTVLCVHSVTHLTMANDSQRRQPLLTALAGLFFMQYCPYLDEVNIAPTYFI